MPKAVDCCGLQESIWPHDEGSFDNKLVVPASDSM